jgi:DNA-binding CsgD family transcriptional regulator
MMDLVEAAVRTGRVREAQAHVDAIRQAEIQHLSPRLRLLAEAATALVTPEASAGAVFERALSIGEVQRWSFDLGRVKLLYGEYLRRTRATLEARSQLSAAQEIFECLGAVPWMMRARQELRAAGLSQPSADDRLPAILTPQEYEIARLAASGLTNKEIGTRLYLSHRTVSAHLYRIFPKLGVTARAALRDALDDVGDQSRSQL